MCYFPRLVEVNVTVFFFATHIFVSSPCVNVQHVMDTFMNTVAMTASVTSVEVEPCTNHTVSVRCALDKAPWSEWSRQETVLSSLNGKKT